MKPRGPRVVVVGAGIVGAAIAYHLARRGAAVTLVDRHRPAGAASGSSFGWINLAHGSPGPCWRLRQLALQDYRRLEKELDGALPLEWCGTLVWQREPAKTERLVRAHAAWGYDISLIERHDIAALEPNLIEPPACAAYAPGEGAVEPSVATETLVRAARQAGAAIRLGTEVVALASHGRRITGVRTHEGTTYTDVVVLAAGTATGALGAQLGVVLPIDASPALLLRFKTPVGLVNTVISSPELEIRRGSGLRLLAAEDYLDGSSQGEAHVMAQRTLATIKARLRGAGAVALENASVGMRPLPADGLPVVGFSSEVDGLYVAVMHAGVTLAPVVGRCAATEILGGAEVDALAPCRPGRFPAASSARGDAPA